MSQVAKEPHVTLEVAEQLGLLPEEFEQIKKNLGRTPNYTELSMYSVMWSEHCSYKNSILWLKKLPKEGPHLLAEAGEENAGLVDIGDGLACCFKIESHNHPSAIEPYQGAATGVGGIHRDIFTMGARPIAALNSLRFGELSSKKTQHLLKGVVKGIGDYGNSFGVPTVAGEVYFEHCYEHNPLVNAMSVGIVETDKVISAISKGEGNPVFIVGSSTGKDGIHGATFASEDITEDSSEKLPSVQVGDPFQEKILLEASLEAIKTGAIVGMQDMGAAGITCSTAEMSEKGGFGMDIQLDMVPLRQQNMIPFEILLSESQERMLIVIEKGQEAAVVEVFDKWDIQYAQIGVVTAGNTLNYFWHGEKVATVPADSLVLGGGAPVYEREYEEPPYYATYQSFDPATIPVPGNLRTTAEAIIAAPNIASKHWIYEQYDSMVQLNNRTTNAPSDAAVIRVPNSHKTLTVTVDCNGRYVHADPYVGAMIAVSECARNITCSGGIPVAITNCLNFGNPYNPHVYWQFVNAIKGMSDACRQFNTPVTGGNVSFYNQNPTGGPVYPTPTIGMLGVMDNPANQMTLDFKATGDVILLVGPVTDDINGSHYLAKVHGQVAAPAPYFDLNTEFDVQQAIRSAIQEGLLQSAHDVSDGGLIVTLIESAIAGNKGCKVSQQTDVRPDAFWFGEGQSRIVVTVSPDKVEAVKQYLHKAGAPCTALGVVTDGAVTVNQEDWGNISDWANKYNTSLAAYL